MADTLLRANRARVTAHPIANWPAGIAGTAVFLPAQQLFAILGPGGAGDLIEALLDVMDAADGDPDREDGDVDCCAAGDDQAGQYLFVGAANPRDDEDREPDDDDHSFGDTTGADPHHTARIRQTRCRPLYSWFELRGPRRIIGYDFKREPTVPRAIKRLRRRPSCNAAGLGL